MPFSVKLYNFSGHSPSDSVVIRIKEDGSWKQLESNNFQLQADGYWRGGMAQETHLLAKKLGIAFCILSDLNFQTIGSMPSLDDEGSLSWHAEDHPEIIDGEWKVLAVS